MSGGGHRSKVSMMPFPARIQLYTLMHDGATFEAVCADTVIAEACARLGITLNAPNLTGVKKSLEYINFIKVRESEQQAAYKDRLTASLLRENASLETLGEQARVALLRLVSDLSDADAANDPATLEKLVRSAVNLTNSAKDERIARLERRIRETEDRAKAEITEKNAEIARLETENAALRAEKSGASRGVSEQTISEIEDKIGLL